jgi:hypothetical protein
MGKSMFEKERKEHPSFTAKQIRQIVKDHKAKNRKRG